jgi:hypothetical protein
VVEHLPSKLWGPHFKPLYHQKECWFPQTHHELSGCGTLSQCHVIFRCVEINVQSAECFPTLDFVKMSPKKANGAPKSRLKWLWLIKLIKRKFEIMLKGSSLCTS